ncbi:hypothetical protein GYMLUDRAFT_155323 [Collybiopsis luxurians FD-317 M1]|nr:hypothetical protein GYMLUDRAFT_155323 [Collybiopsis luxurians FD-317 M1]
MAGTHSLHSSIDVLSPPTTFLPPIRSLSSLTEPDRLLKCIRRLQEIYVPEVRGSRRRRKSKTPHDSDSGLSLAAIRRDLFERAYALRWLSALIRLESSLDLSQAQSYAAALLAICAGTASAGSLQRQLEFGGGRVKVVLNDVPLSTNASNGDYMESVGAQTWGGACVLADEIADTPEAFFPADEAGKVVHVLELGAGTGLVSLVIGKVAILNNIKMDVIATDYHSSVLDNLKANIRANFSAPTPSLTISSQFLDWSVSTSELAGSPFDLILGADIIYEPLHASWISSVLETHLRKPEDDTGGLFHLVIPLRPSFAAESSTIEEVFNFGTSVDTDYSGLVIISKQIIVCDADEDDGSNIVQYAYFVIGWKRGNAVVR